MGGKMHQLKMYTIGVMFVLTTVSCLERPEQVHISYGDTPDQMVVLWSTLEDVKGVVQYGEDKEQLTEQQNGSATRLTLESWNARQYIHRAQLKKLKAKTKYFYKVTSVDGTTTAASRIFSFTTMDVTTARRAAFLVYGDLGVEGKETFSRLQQEVDSGDYDSIWHIGDFAYDMQSNGGLVGDQFMRAVENIAANIPYMTSPGNHEIAGAEEFLHYRTRFSTPGTPWPIPLNSMWYSYNVGPVHFISYSTEVYFTHDQNYVCEQYDWLLKDLIQANQNRGSQPWIVAMGHRPMYCSNNNIDDCTGRIFSGWVRRSLEDLFHVQGVDLVIEAHEHSYERLFPLYKGNLVRTDYNNLTTTVHVISGAAGNKEGSNSMASSFKPWSAYRHDIVGDNTYGRLVVHNSTHLHWDQVRAVNGGVIDSMWLVQYNHGPFVSNVDCGGKGGHSSCHCPTPFHYLTAAICILVALVMVLVGIIACVVMWRRRRRNKTYQLMSTVADEDNESLLSL
ncbi:acid phosphatase type 7-like [Haliotis cracherodii]|uniref:acid phosphatase type 7-like n=1 Tax=Haliotis cracherodii TaxID=6455 RepID=UPI0039EAEF66